MTASNQVMLQLEHTLRSHASVVAENTRVARLGVPQIWGIAELRAHYPAYGDDHLKSKLVQHCGYVPQRGVPIAIHVDQVLRLDEILKRESGLTPQQLEGAHHAG